MLELLRLLIPPQLLAPLLKPVTRLLIGLMAVPAFRWFLRRVVRVNGLDQELERDLELWFRGAILLLVASANMEQAFFGWVPLDLREEKGWMILAGRLMLAIGVIEGMPDQSLFAIIHPGPPPFKVPKTHRLQAFVAYLPQLIRGLICKHLNRSSPVFAIMAVFQDGWVGWACYGLAIVQYLIIGLVTSRDRAVDVLNQFDEAIHQQRMQLEHELKQSAPAEVASESSGDILPSGLDSTAPAGTENLPVPSGPVLASCELGTAASADSRR
jgi:hypothetical protein